MIAPLGDDRNRVGALVGGVDAEHLLPAILLVILNVDAHQRVLIHAQAQLQLADVLGIRAVQPHVAALHHPLDLVLQLGSAVAVLADAAAHRIQAVIALVDVV